MSLSCVRAKCVKITSVGHFEQRDLWLSSLFPYQTLGHMSPAHYSIWEIQFFFTQGLMERPSSWILPSHFQPSPKITPFVFIILSMMHVVAFLFTYKNVELHSLHFSLNLGDTSSLRHPHTIASPVVDINLYK